jgi:uncharacterized protein involved in outer membrane biogenesis
MAGKLPGLLRISLILVNTLLGLLLAALLLVTLVRIPIDLSMFRAGAESTLSEALGRDVRLQGELKVTTSLWPYFEVTGLHVASPKEFDEATLVSMERARVVLALMPLLQGQVHIRTFEAEGLLLNLVRLENGAVNWAPVSPREMVDHETDRPPPRADALIVDELLLGDISVFLYEEETDTTDTFLLTQARGSARSGEPVKLDMVGALREQPYEVHIETSSLAEFLAMAHARVEIDIAIADTELSFRGFTDALGQRGELRLDMSVAGRQLSSLNALLAVDLPPIADYRLDASFRAAQQRLELVNLALAVGDSQLKGSALLDATLAPPVAQLDLNSEQIQLDDFDTGDWSPQPTETGGEKSQTAGP